MQIIEYPWRIIVLVFHLLPYFYHFHSNNTPNLHYEYWSIINWKYNSFHNPNIYQLKHRQYISIINVFTQRIWLNTTKATLSRLVNNRILSMLWYYNITNYAYVEHTFGLNNCFIYKVASSNLYLKLFITTWRCKPEKAGVHNHKNCETE